MSDLLPKDDLSERATYVPPQQESSRIKTALIIAVILLALSALAGAARFGWMYVQEMYGGVDEAAAFFENRARLTDLIAQLPNIESQDLARGGFWYTYTDSAGNEHVLYFDLDQFARANLSDADMRALLDTVSHSRVTPRDTTRELDEIELPPALQFHNQLYSFGTAGVTSLSLKDLLEAKMASESMTSDDLFRLAYIYELEGNYAKRDALDTKNCERFGARCGSEFMIALTGRVVDLNDNPIEGATVEVASRPEIKAAQSGPDGAYEFSLPVQEMEKVRIRATKRNYSDGFQDVVLVTGGRGEHAVPDIDLSSPITIVTINPARKTVTGTNNSIRPDGTYVITTAQSVYEIPANAIVDESGTPYISGPIDVYLYEFSKGNIPESLTEVDTFDAVVGYAGDLMKTFGMPYIQFFATDGTELHVLSSNSMTLTYKIVNMESLRTNEDNIYRPLTNDDMEILVQASIGHPFGIDRQFLINNQLLQFPAFWVFDRRRGVWDNVGISVLDTNGTIRSRFYTMRDDR